MFEPGARWQYGQGVDWAGRLVEATSGLTLENYFQEKIFRPLGMEDTSYILSAAKFDRMVSRYHREDGSDLKEDERKLPAPPTTFNGGGGLYATAADYVRFMQMILNHGTGPNNVRILQSKTVDSMITNQIGELTAGKMKSFKPNTSAEVDIQPGHTEKWGLGFLINTTPYADGRSAGSLAWAGLYNTFYWIDPKLDCEIRTSCSFLPRLPSSHRPGDIMESKCSLSKHSVGDFHHGLLSMYFLWYNRSLPRGTPECGLL